MADLVARALGKKALSPTKNKTWTSTSGQLVYTLDEPYTTGQILVYVDGIPQISGIHFSETNSTSITLLCNTSDIVAGMTIIATYK